MKENKAQQKAILHGDGPCMVLAGPGSGKTTVITMRLKHLIKDLKINPANILVITFTKAAAIEMKERFEKIAEEEGLLAKGITFGTFHAIFFSILKQAYNLSSDNIVKEEDRYKVVKQSVLSHGIDMDDEREFLSKLLGEIGKVKGEMMDSLHYFSTTCSADDFRKVYSDYTRTLKNNKLIDFDDMLIMCYELLKERSDILAAWQNKFKYILIDEFQDINRVQYETVKLLAKPQNNLFVVGDDDQSIYGFRGSKPEIMLGFGKDYPGTVTVNLDINYRSTSDILDPATKLISLNCARYKKKITAAKGNGNPVMCVATRDFIDEYSQVAESIRMLTTGGDCSYGDVAVLYRTASGIGSLVRKLMEYNIPFRIKDSIPDIYEHWIAKDIFAYIRVAMGSHDRGDFLQIMNKPKRYIGRDYLTDQEIDLDVLARYYDDKDWMVERIEKLQRDLTMLRSLNPFAAVNYIRRGIAYDDYLSEYALAHQINIEELYDVINELADSARNYNTFEEWSEAIKKYRSEVSLNNRKNEGDRNRVTLTTMHSSKGLEFDYVYIVDANEGNCPHKKAILDTDLEEERRMFYVAMTRARKQLNIYYTKEKFNKKTSISRYLFEAGLMDAKKLF